MEIEFLISWIRLGAISFIATNFPLWKRFARISVVSRRSLTRDKVGILEFADSSITLSAGLWCQQADYMSVLFGMNQGIFEAFKRSGIEMPFPQRDVHLYKKEG